MNSKELLKGEVDPFSVNEGGWSSFFDGCVQRVRIAGQG
jgi:hypothetical protein